MSIHGLEHTSPADGFYDVRDQLRWHIYRRSEEAFDAGDRARDALVDASQLPEYQNGLREFFVASIGGLPPMDTDLSPRTSGIVRCNGFWIEKVIFQSAPRRYVTGNLYVPDGLDGPRAAVLFLCGHAAEARLWSEYQEVCQVLALAGLVVFAQDPIGQGERLSYWEPALGYPSIGVCTAEHDYSGAQCQAVGDNQARYELHDAMRSIDYMVSRPEIDPARIGVTGNSGGGTQTSLMMLADPRVAAAAPGTFIMNRRTYMHAGGAQDAEQIWRGFTAAGYDHEDILIAMAPKPVRVLAVTSDFFPIEGTRETVERCKRIWTLFGREQDVDLVVDRSAHSYTRNLTLAAADFFSRHLLGHEAGVDQSRIAALEPKQIQCTVTGQVRGDYADAEAVFEANRGRMRELEAAREEIEPGERRSRAVQWLRERVAAHRRPCDLNPRFRPTSHVDDLFTEGAIWWSQEGLLNHAFRFCPMALRDRDLPVTIAIWFGGTNVLQPHYDWIRATCAGERAVVVLDVTGEGALLPNPLADNSLPHEYYGVIHKLADDLRWLDDDLAAMRVWDVLRAIDMVAQWPGCLGEDLRLYCHGRHGLYGRLAAAIDDRVASVEVVEGWHRIADWVGSRHYNAHDIKSLIIDGMLRTFDLPDIECCCDGA